MKPIRLWDREVCAKTVWPARGWGRARTGQPPEVRQQPEPEASGKGHVHLAVSLGLKFRGEGVVALFFPVPYCSDQTRAHGQVWAPPEEGPCSKEACLPRETGFGRLLCDQWLREPRRRLRGGGGDSRREEERAMPLQTLVRDVLG